MDSAPSSVSAVSAAATAVVTTGIGGGVGCIYPDSMDSSPRSRGGESWDEPASRPPSVSAHAAGPPQKLRLMCSYGGHIMPRPHDKTLCYLGGDTRIVVVDRHASLADLFSKISRSLLGGHAFGLKYQLPSEDLDSLISVTTDEDLENMIDEYDRIVSGATRVSGGGGGVGAGAKSSRLRLFLFPAKAESSPTSSMGSLLDDSKSDTWFVDALNGGPIGTGGILPRRLSDDSMASSINCLLGLEEDRHQKTPPSAAIHPLDQIGGGDHNLSTDHHHHNNHHQQLVQPESPGKLAAAGKNNGQEVQSMPDSPMLDTSSSFGSTSSAPSLSNLPPIRLRPEDPSHDQQPSAGGLEEHFANLGVSAQKQQDEGFKDGAFVTVHEQPPPPHPSFITAVASPPSATNSAATAFSPTEHPHFGVNRAFSSDDEKSDHGGGGVWKPAQPHISPVQQPRASAPDHQNTERPLLHQDRASPGAGGSNPFPEMFFEAQNSLFVSNIGAHMQNPDQGYAIHMQQHQQQQQLPQQQHQLQQQQQQQHQPRQQQQHQPQQQPQSQPSLPQLPHYLHPSPHLVPYPSYYLQPQQHMTPTSHYSQQAPLYFVPVHTNPSYAPTPQSNLSDAAAVPAPNSMAAAPPANPPQPTPELVSGAAIYRTSVAGNTAMAPPPPSPQLIQQPYMGYHHHASQAVMASGYGYEYANAVHSQPMYYAAHANSAPLAPQYQAAQYQVISSAAAATMIPDHQTQMLHLADTNQTKASS